MVEPILPPLRGPALPWAAFQFVVPTAPPWFDILVDGLLPSSSCLICLAQVSKFIKCIRKLGFFTHCLFCSYSNLYMGRFLQNMSFSCFVSLEKNCWPAVAKPDLLRHFLILKYFYFLFSCWNIPKVYSTAFVSSLTSSPYCHNPLLS